jgi:hypothetical protein
MDIQYVCIQTILNLNTFCLENLWRVSSVRTVIRIPDEFLGIGLGFLAVARDVSRSLLARGTMLAYHKPPWCA